MCVCVCANDPETPALSRGGKVDRRVGGQRGKGQATRRRVERESERERESVSINVFYTHIMTSLVQSSRCIASDCDYVCKQFVVRRMRASDAENILTVLSCLRVIAPGPLMRPIKLWPFRRSPLHPTRPSSLHHSYPCVRAHVPVFGAPMPTKGPNMLRQKSVRCGAGRNA